MLLRSAAAALAIGALFIIGCGGVTDPSKNMVENFPGVVEPGGPPFERKFTINNLGEYSVKITALSPTPTAYLGVALRQGGNCEFPFDSTFATLNVQALGGPIFQKGAYCLWVFDPGTLTVAQNFTVTVSHP
jgi:hypothetical protein